MRTTLKDSGLITVAAYQPDAGGGNGVALGGGNGLPYAMSRTGTGDYTYNFDGAVTPLSIIAVGGGGTVLLISTGPGTFRVQTFTVAGTQANGPVRWILTARDSRR